MSGSRTEGESTVVRRVLKWVGGLVLLGLIARIPVIVDETEHAIITTFGKPVRAITAPGLTARWPFQGVIRFDRRLRVYDPRASEFLTGDRTNLLLDNYVCWRISDADLFLRVLGTVPRAEMRLHDVVWSELSAAVGRVTIDEMVTAEAEAESVVTESMLASVTERCREFAAEGFGIEIVEVNLKRLGFPKQNKQSVYERMRAERERIAKKYRAEGRAEATKISADADKEAERLLAEAYREAEKTRGDADAQATRTYAAAHEEDPGFYELVRKLAAYKTIFKEDTTIVLSGRSPLLRLMTEGPAGR
jgi:membrane protease subunit HflC